VTTIAPLTKHDHASHDPLQHEDILSMYMNLATKKCRTRPEKT
jgi:hypothetical protein